tara:strand:+ start:2653 stop:3834 length:1182 start_codon:yes stop_codon:yes gene_type:complete
LLKNLLNKNYLIFGSAIIGTRALEYLVLFFAAHYLSKDNYGELEYYKKLIEVGSSVFAFGLPALIISYTKSRESKQYFFLLSVLFVLFIFILSIPILGLFNWLFLLIPFVFYALFFNGGITPAYLLVIKGSNYASIYKIIVSIFFYLILFISIYYFDITAKAYVITSYFLLPLAIIYIIYEIYNQKIVKIKAQKYWGLFRKLLISSSTLVVSNFANLMFLYTDIFLIQMISENSKSEIADFSFALNIATMLLLIPITMVQVDIETLKSNKLYFSILNRKIFLLTIIFSVFLIGVYYFLINAFFDKYANTFYLFLVLLAAKLFHSFSSLFGTYLLILKKFKLNLCINIASLLTNIVLCYFGYFNFGLIGLASASLISLLMRYFALYYFKGKYSN